MFLLCLDIFFLFLTQCGFQIWANTFFWTEENECRDFNDDSKVLYDTTLVVMILGYLQFAALPFLLCFLCCLIPIFCVFLFNGIPNMDEGIQRNLPFYGDVMK